MIFNYAFSRLYLRLSGNMIWSKEGMKRRQSDGRWLMVVVLISFIVFHQLDIYLFDSVSPSIAASYYLSAQQLENLSIGVLIVDILFFPFWGWLFDRHTRKKLLGVAAFIWGATSILRVLAPTSPTFFISHLASGVDNACYPGIFSLVSDEFSPRNRGKIIGLIQMALPFSNFILLILTTLVTWRVHWRTIFTFSGLVGLLFVPVLVLALRHPKRGVTEPALSEVRLTGIYIFDLDTASDLLRKPSLILMYVLSFFSGIPWGIIQKYFINFLETTFDLPYLELFFMMAPTFLAAALGYLIGGWFGDLWFAHNKRGRIFVSLIGVVFSSLCFVPIFYFTPFEGQFFLVLMLLTAIFMAFLRPNIISTLFDVALPEVRSMAVAALMMGQFIGSTIVSLGMAPLIEKIGLRSSILWGIIGAWLICFILLVTALFIVPKDIEQLRKHIAYRSQLESRVGSLKKRS